jgi:RNA polymerase I-specific transcription initiation factor RRN5
VTDFPVPVGICLTMDSDSSYEEPSEVSEEESSTDHGGEAVIAHALENPSRTGTKSSLVYSKRSRQRRTTETKEQRWQRLQSHYNDQYLNLLNESSDGNIDSLEAPQNGFECTQIGLSSWSALDKAKFFPALSKKSKANVRGIATSVESKSELEVYDYLRLLEEEDRNRHLYAEEVNNVSHADIPAAAELSSECEALLEKAADALIVYQEKFDQALGEQAYHDAWLIDHVQAKVHDQLVDAAEDGSPSDINTLNSRQIPARSLFKLSSWLSLTERLFMNADPARNDNNWVVHAAQDEVPAITQGAISDFYDLALCQLHKIMSTSVFCAESRIRSIKARGYDAKALVKEQDVAAAISLLGLQEERSHFWLTLARRNKLNVVDDYHKKGQGQETRLDYEEVERILRETASTRRGRRSVSTESGPRSLSQDSDRAGECSISDGMIDSDLVTSDHSAGQQSFKQARQPQILSLCGDIRLLAEETDQVSDDGESNTASSEGEPSEADEQDRHLEILDQLNSWRTELQLHHHLGWAMPEDAKFRPWEELKGQEEFVQPSQRKARPELLDWRKSIIGYAESWEEHGEVVEANFVENGRRTKRRRIDHDRKQQDLPFRTPRRQSEGREALDTAIGHA